jgi:uncharacterized protein YggE
MNRRDSILTGGVVITICLTILLSTLILANGNFYIKNLGTSLEQDGKILNSITVDGEGKVYVKPDIAILSISVSETAPTSSEALQNTNKKMSSIVGSLLALGIKSEDIQTSQLNISTDYDYLQGGKKILGQTATIALSVKVRNIGDDASKAAQAIDEVSKVPNVSIGSISFDLDDKTEAYSQARELAFNKAKQKAENLATDSSVKLLKPVSIIEKSSPDVSPLVYTNVAEASPTTSDSKSTSLQSGQLELIINVEVVFGID